MSHEKGGFNLSAILTIGTRQIANIWMVCHLWQEIECAMFCRREMIGEGTARRDGERREKV